MPDEKRQINEGYIPQKNERGYQPETSKPSQSIGDSESQKGYVPTTVDGKTTTNKPLPPGDE